MRKAFIITCLLLVCQPLIAAEDIAMREGEKDVLVKEEKKDYKGAVKKDVVTIQSSEEYVKLGWEASSKNDLKLIDKLVEECRKYYGAEAKLQQEQLTDFPKRGDEKDREARKRN